MKLSRKQLRRLIIEKIQSPLTPDLMKFLYTVAKWADLGRWASASNVSHQMKTSSQTSFEMASELEQLGMIEINALGANIHKYRLTPLAKIRLNPSFVQRSRVIKEQRMKITKRKLRKLINEVRWQFDPSSPTGMSQRQEDQWVLERSGVKWAERFLVRYDMNRPNQDPVWGSFEQSMKFDSRQMAYHYSKQIERSTGFYSRIEDASAFRR